MSQGKIMATLAISAGEDGLIARLDGAIPAHLVPPVLYRLGRLEELLVDYSGDFDAEAISESLSEAPKAVVDFPERLSNG